jgi:hypothetical protein
VKNKARVEGSICNAYLVEESSTFFSYYFGPDVETRHTNVHRNEEFSTQGEEEHLLSVCNIRGSSLGSIQTRFLNGAELRVATNYILLNCEEVQPYIQEFSNGIRTQSPGITDSEIEKLVEDGFARWFKEYVSWPKL